MRSWLRTKLRRWLGVEQLAKKTGDLWWDIHDGAGLKAKQQEHERMLALLGEMSAHPECFKWDEFGATWKSPNLNTSKKTVAVWINRPSDYLGVLKALANNETRDKDYFKTERS